MILLSFLLALVLVAGGLVLVVVRAVELWRQTKRTGRAFASELERFEERSARTERLLAEAEESSRALEAALERLRISRARLQVLRSALERSAQRTRWLRAFLPV